MADKAQRLRWLRQPSSLGAEGSAEGLDKVAAEQLRASKTGTAAPCSRPSTLSSLAGYQKTAYTLTRYVPEAASFDSLQPGASYAVQASVFSQKAWAHVPSTHGPCTKTQADWQDAYKQHLAGQQQAASSTQAESRNRQLLASQRHVQHTGLVPGQLQETAPPTQLPQPLGARMSWSNGLGTPALLPPSHCSNPGPLVPQGQSQKPRSRQLQVQTAPPSLHLQAFAHKPRRHWHRSGTQQLEHQTAVSTALKAFTHNSSSLAAQEVQPAARLNPLLGQVTSLAANCNGEEQAVDTYQSSGSETHLTRNKGQQCLPQKQSAAPGKPLAHNQQSRMCASGSQNHQAVATGNKAPAQPAAAVMDVADARLSTYRRNKRFQLVRSTSHSSANHLHSQANSVAGTRSTQLSKSQAAGSHCLAAPTAQKLVAPPAPVYYKRGNSLVRLGLRGNCPVATKPASSKAQVAAGGRVASRTAARLVVTSNQRRPIRRLTVAGPPSGLQHGHKVVRINGSLYKVSVAGRHRKLQAVDRPKVATSTQHKLARPTPRPAPRTRVQPTQPIIPSNPPLRLRAASSSVQRSLARARARAAAAKAVKKRGHCLQYCRTGRCANAVAGRCPHVHDPSQIAVCPKWLAGTCTDAACPLQHRRQPQLMPVCSYFLEGVCSSMDCPYLHVNYSPNAPVCRAFLQGHCPNGADCQQKHFTLKMAKQWQLKRRREHQEKSKQRKCLKVDAAVTT